MGVEAIIIALAVCVPAIVAVVFIKFGQKLMKYLIVALVTIVAALAFVLFKPYFGDKLILKPNIVPKTVDKKFANFKDTVPKKVIRDAIGVLETHGQKLENRVKEIEADFKSLGRPYEKDTAYLQLILDHYQVKLDSAKLEAILEAAYLEYKKLQLEVTPAEQGRTDLDRLMLKAENLAIKIMEEYKSRDAKKSDPDEEKDKSHDEKKSDPDEEENDSALRELTLFHVEWS